MSKSVAVQITDSLITKQLADLAVTELRDLRSPLMLRIQKNRTKATWYLVQYEKGQKQRYRLGYWPFLKTKDAQSMVAEKLKLISVGEFSAADRLMSVRELLVWYRDRCVAEKFKATNRKKTIISHINHHLLPKLGSFSIGEINKQIIDEHFFLPLQAEGLKASTIKNLFYTLKPAFKRAVSLGYISHNPMSDIIFGQHITKRIKPKECALQVTDCPDLLKSLLSQPQSRRMFLLFMLLYGTRIGETRSLKWDHIKLAERRIVIPAELTKTEDSHVLPITEQAFLLLNEHKTTTPPSSEYLFTFSGRQLTETRAQFLVRSASESEWSAHDLRKVARSSWAELGIDYWVSERLLNHKQKGLDAVYIKADAYEVKLAALKTYHDWLFSSGIKQAQEVAA